jgi:hypothetical protein
MKITLNELRSLVKQVIREAKEEKSKKKGFDVSKLKKGVKLTVDMGKGEEKVEVMDNFKAGVTDLKFVTLKRSKGAPYTITIGKLKDVIVEGYGELNEEIERSEEDNDPISIAKNKAKSKYDWVEDALEHGFTKEELEKMSSKKIDELIDYLHSCK